MKKPYGTAFKLVGVVTPDKNLSKLNFTKDQRDYIAAQRKSDYKEGFINGSKLIN